MTSEVKIRLSPMGIGSVELDGHEIQNALAGFTINANAGEPVTLVARLTPVALHYVGRVDVKLPEPTRQLLLAAGWTPPTEPVKEGS
jgi:hypothetical protein